MSDDKNPASAEVSRLEVYRAIKSHEHTDHQEHSQLGLRMNGVEAKLGEVAETVATVRDAVSRQEARLQQFGAAVSTHAADTRRAVQATEDLTGIMGALGERMNGLRRAITWGSLIAASSVLVALGVVVIVLSLLPRPLT